MNRPRSRTRGRIAGVWLLGLAAAVRAEDAVPPPVPVSPAVVTAPAPAEPVSPILATRWRLRPWIGGTTLRLGGLEQFPVPAAERIERNWTLTYGAQVDSREVTPLDLGLVHGVDASFQVDPLVSVGARLARLDSARGSRLTKMSAGTTKFRDEWEYDTAMLMIMGGAGFHLPIGVRTRLNVSLFLGTGLADVRVAHRVRSEIAGTILFSEGAADATGTSFFPEFALELEHDLGESLGVGAGLGYRFGGIESFTVRRATSVNLVFSGIESEEGAPLRDGNRSLLAADYGGLVLAVYLAARM